MNTPGYKFRQAIADNNPLMVVGAVNAYCAKMAEMAGHKALYLSGAGVANASFGLPDLAITTLNDVAEDSRRITQATNLPLLIEGLQTQEPLHILYIQLLLFFQGMMQYIQQHLKHHVF